MSDPHGGVNEPESAGCGEVDTAATGSGSLTPLRGDTPMTDPQALAARIREGLTLARVAGAMNCDGSESALAELLQEAELLKRGFDSSQEQLVKVVADRAEWRGRCERAEAAHDDLVEALREEFRPLLADALKKASDKNLAATQVFYSVARLRSWLDSARAAGETQA